MLMVFFLWINKKGRKRNANSSSEMSRLSLRHKLAVITKNSQYSNYWKRIFQWRPTSLQNNRLTRVRATFREEMFDEIERKKVTSGWNFIVSHPTSFKFHSDENRSKFTTSTFQVQSVVHMMSANTKHVKATFSE